MKNDLERVSFTILDELTCVKDKLMDLGALKSLMSGSGPSIYGVFDEFESAKKAEEFFVKEGYSAFAVKPVY